MTEDSLVLQDLDDLKSYVHKTICRQNELEENVFPMTERFLVRNGVPCGIYFCLHGPRSIQFTAIWETDHNTIFFYSETGQRRHKIQLVQAPSLRLVTACC
jgi:hypothetical protein